MTAPILTIPSTRPDPAPSGIETGDPELREGLRLEHAGRLLGVFPIPAALLLLPPLERGTPDEARGREALPRLLAGDAGGELPGAWAFLEPVSRGDLAAASALLTAGRSETEPRDPVLRYSRLVLSGRAEDLERWNAEGGPPAELGPLVDALAFVHGWIDQAPSPGAGLPPEAAAAVQMVRAAWHLEQGAAAAAQEDLAQALGRVRERSPLFAAQLAAQRAELLRETDPPASLADLRLAVELSEGTALPGLRADLFLALGLTLHAMADGRRGPLLEAVRAYQEALQQGITADTRRDDFALVQSHLGLAYLSLPMEEPSARLRQAVAVQSLKKALEIYRPESHPEAWASTQLNLANALQYLPSAHPRENLVQAVELYEALLE
ncbi:MAG: hypothetical protein MI919_26695, partial [Holophagales bacterium]|nr:hypothetical protein [Holophagales bacterium]